jgi:hypothetical protein
MIKTWFLGIKKTIKLNQDIGRFKFRETIMLLITLYLTHFDNILENEETWYFPGCSLLNIAVTVRHINCQVTVVIARYTTHFNGYHTTSFYKNDDIIPEISGLADSTM